MNKGVNKKAVSSIRDYLSAINKPISQAQGYEVLARAHDLKNANTLAGVSNANSAGNTVAPTAKSSTTDTADTDAPVSYDEHAAYLNVLATRHSLSTVMVDHALGMLDDEYDDETVIPLANGRAIHCPAYPSDCEYVRVVLEGYELMYWHCDEWAESPMEVMGALLGIAHG